MTPTHTTPRLQGSPMTRSSGWPWIRSRRREVVAGLCSSLPPTQPPARALAAEISSCSSPS
jgi:hypothetical protein